MNATAAGVFQPELIELMKAVLDDATAMLPEAHVGYQSRNCVQYSGICRKRRARPGSAENGGPFGHGRVHTLFARSLARAPGSVSRPASDLSLS